MKGLGFRVLGLGMKGFGFRDEGFRVYGKSTFNLELVTADRPENLQKYDPKP